MAVLTLSLLLATGCIDEDLSRCGVDYAVDYRLELSPSLQHTLDTAFTTPGGKALATSLRSDLGDVLGSNARVLDLSFFNASNGQLRKHDRTNPDASTASVTVYMNRSSYYNVALAATGNVGGRVSIDDADTYAGIRLRQAAADTADAYSPAIYMGLELLAPPEGSTRYFVPLYMVNSVPVLVVETAGTTAQVEAVYVRGVATGLRCSDSTFTFTKPSVVSTRLTNKGTLRAYHCVCFPSQGEAATGRADTDATNALWQIDVYTRMATGQDVKNTLNISEPLRAGEMEIIKAVLRDDGSITTDMPEVGVSVEIGWNEGSDIEVGM